MCSTYLTLIGLPTTVSQYWVVKSRSQTVQYLFNVVCSRSQYWVAQRPATNIHGVSTTVSLRLRSVCVLFALRCRNCAIILHIMLSSLSLSLSHGLLPLVLLFLDLLLPYPPRAPAVPCPLQEQGVDTEFFRQCARRVPTSKEVDDGDPHHLGVSKKGDNGRI